MAHYAGTPYEEDLRSAFEKLAEALPNEVSVDLGALQETVSFDPGPTRPIGVEMYRTAIFCGSTGCDSSFWNSCSPARPICPKRVDMNLKDRNRMYAWEERHDLIK